MSSRLPACLPALVLLAACGPAGETGFRYGAPRSVEVEGREEVEDPVSGLTFGFPEGGRGALVIREILSAPDRPRAGGRGFQVQHDGNAEFMVRVPVAEGEEASCLAWGFLEGSADGGVPREGRWIPVSGTDLEDGTWAYEWVMPFDISGDAADTGRLSSALVPGSNHLGSSQYWINSVKPGADEVERRVALGLQFGDDVDAWLDALPAGLQAQARTRVAGLRPERFHDDNYYIGFTRHRLWSTVTPMIGLRLDADANSIAHEVGHYMTHVLAGDEPYLAIEDTAPDASHGQGIFQPGRILVEDYAYFSQFFLTGSVRGADPTLVRTLLGPQDPRKVDLPGVEGFGCALLASLVRTSAVTIALVSADEEAVPVVAAPVGDVLALHATGAVSADGLWPHLEAFVADHGRAGALPVLAERAGWSFAGEGRVLDEEGRPLEGVEVVNIVTVDGTVYDNGKRGRAKTGDDGRFRLTRLFPGNSVVRLELPSGRKDVPVYADPAGPTTTWVDLGDLAGAGGPETVSHCAVAFAADFAWDGDPGLYVMGIGVDPYWYSEQQGSEFFSGDTWQAQWTTYPGAGITTTGTFRAVLSPAHDRVLSFEAVARDTMGDVPNAEQAVDGHDLPLTGTREGEWTFRVKGTAACDHVDRAVKVARLDDGVPYLEVTGWTCDAESALTVTCR